MEKSPTMIIWVGSRNCRCLVTWFCYQMIAKPGNKTGTVSWPDQCVHESISQYSHTALDRHILSSVFQYIKIILTCRWKPIQNVVISFKRYAHSDLDYLYLLDKCGYKSSKTLGLYSLSGKRLSDKTCIKIKSQSCEEGCSNDHIKILQVDVHPFSEQRPRSGPCLMNLKDIDSNMQELYMSTCEL